MKNYKEVLYQGKYYLGCAVDVSHYSDTEGQNPICLRPIWRSVQEEKKEDTKLEALI